MRTWLAALVLALPVGSLAGPEAGPRFEIQLLEGRFTPPDGVAAGSRSALLGRASAVAASGGRHVHALLQLRELPDERQRAELAEAGVDLHAYVPGQAFVAAIAVDRLAQALARPELRAALPWDAERKQHPRVKVRDFGPWTRDPERPEWVMLIVQLHQDVALKAGVELAEALGGAALDPIDGIHGLTLWLPEARIPELAAREEVLWIEEGPAPLSPTNDGVRAQTRADSVIAAPYSLSGSGVRLFVFDGGTIRATHETFNPGAGSRASLLDAASLSEHATHVAGTAGGDGMPSSAGGRGRGVASSAQIFSAGYQQSGGTMLFWDNAGDIQADYATARANGADLGTNSIGSNTASNGYPCSREGDYGVSSNLLDGIVRGDNATVGSAVIMTWANGNERSGGSAGRGRCGTNYVTTAPPSCAKNPIHVGAINSDGGAMTGFSSWGPCDDGRLKPIVSAPGCEIGFASGEAFIYSSLDDSDTAYGSNVYCGTSMATPAVGGIVALLIQDWRARGHGGANERPLPALVKAWLVQTARDSGPPGPDFSFGYGAVDAKAAVDLLRAGNGALGTGSTNWGTDSVTNGVNDSFSVVVPAGTASLKATLAWDDFAAAAFAASAPVNNLDLELVAPNGTTLHLPFVLSAASPHLAASTGANSVDNQEQVLVTNPTTGTWTIRVKGTSVPQGPQSYGLAYTTTANVTGESCNTTSYGFEAGNDGWTLQGASRVAAPAAGHGSFSIQFGGAVSSAHLLHRSDVAIPANATQALLSVYWHMTTNESTTDGGYDNFRVEVRNLADANLAVLDARSDGWTRSQWLQAANLDLTPWRGQTVRLALVGSNDSTLTTTFWADDVALRTCTATPALSVADVLSVTEGNTGTRSATFQVTMNPPATSTVTVAYATANGTATASADYTTTNGTLTFAAGVTQASVNVPVLGDTLDENDETFFFDLSSASGAVLQDSSGTATILDDDPLPSLALSAGPTVLERDVAGLTADFTVTLSPASGRSVTIGYATGNQTALAGTDYAATSGTLTFTAGQTQRTLSVPVVGDLTPEPNETFSLTLSGPSNASLTQAGGSATIRDDDPVAADFGGDGKSDVVVYRAGAWLFFNYQTGGALPGVFTGDPGSCIPAPGDFDGNGSLEFSQLCGANWFFYGPTGSLTKTITPGGTGLDVPVPADYDGDGDDDVVVYRQGAWLTFSYQTGGFTSGVFTGHPPHFLGGTPVPYPADFDGDGKADFSIYAGGPWHFYNPNGTYKKGIWTGSIAGDITVAGDYDGDGVDDVVVWRNGAWLWFDYTTGNYSAANSVFTGAPPHQAGGVPTPSPIDVDGDGRLNRAVYSGGPWHFYQANGSYDRGVFCGSVAGDRPISRRPLP